MIRIIFNYAIALPGFALFLLFALSVPNLMGSSPVHAQQSSSKCGSAPELGNKNLARLAASSAAFVAQRGSTDGAAYRRMVALEYKRLSSLAEGADKAALNEFYFHHACRALVESKAPIGLTIGQVRRNLEIIAQVVGNPNLAKTVIQDLVTAAPGKQSKQANKTQNIKKPLGNNTAKKNFNTRGFSFQTHSKAKPPAQPSAPNSPGAGQAAQRQTVTQSAKRKTTTGVNRESTGSSAANEKAAETRLQTDSPATTETATETAAETATETAAPSRPSSSAITPTSQAKVQRQKECAELGVIGTSDCQNFDSIIKNLKTAPLAYNHPKSMYLGKRTQISLVLKTNEQDHKAELEGLKGEVKEGATKISRIMQAEISGENFKVEPSGPQQRTITTIAPVKWTWFVTPLEQGENKRLNLELSAILREGTRDLPPVTIRTFRTQIAVDVRWWDLVMHRIKAFDPVYQLATALGGLVTALLFIWRILSWRRRKSQG